MAFKKNKYKYKELIKRAHKDYPKWIWDEEPREEYNFEKITNFKDELLVLNIFKESTSQPNKCPSSENNE